jgi:Asp-tRNA(Asn)/Glu-tRNA(Gln) amidotransferase A subunit family amidase
MDSIWVVRLDAPGDGPRLAVKDCIDVEGLPTTAGCQAIAEQAGPADRSADRRQDRPDRAVLVGQRGEPLAGHPAEPA